MILNYFFKLIVRRGTQGEVGGPRQHTQLFAWRQDKGSHLGFSQVCVLYDNMELKACLWATQAAALVPSRLAWVGRKSEPRGWRRGP